MSNVNLQEYFNECEARGVIDHEVRAQTFKNGLTKFYIHPKGVNGRTLDFEVHGNHLRQIRFDELDGA